MASEFGSFLIHKSTSLPNVLGVSSVCDKGNLQNLPIKKTDTGEPILSKSKYLKSYSLSNDCFVIEFFGKKPKRRFLEKQRCIDE